MIEPLQLRYIIAAVGQRSGKQPLRKGKKRHGKTSKKGCSFCLSPRRSGGGSRPVPDFGKDAGTDFFKTSLSESLRDLPGWSLQPTVFPAIPSPASTAWNVRLSFEDGEIARADNLTVSLSLLSLLKGSAGIDKISVKNAFVAAEDLFAAARKTELPSAPGGKPLDLPVVILTPSEVSTPLGNVKLDLLRLTPGQGTVTLEGKGNFLGMPVEMGGSLAEDESISLTDGFLKAGSATATLSGEMFPEFFLEGAVESLDLEKAASLLSVPFSMKGTVASTLTISRPAESFSCPARERYSGATSGTSSRKAGSTGPQTERRQLSPRRAERFFPRPWRAASPCSLPPPPWRRSS